MKNIEKTRTAIKRLLNEIEVPPFDGLKKSKKDAFAEKRNEMRLKYLKYAKKALNPVSQKYFYLNLEKGEKPSVAIENKQDTCKFREFRRSNRKKND